MGNVINRVFDSSGPEGKVRGTPQQIIDKYLTLHRDATLSNDRVAAENFLQHAEHYTRILSEAVREQEARREAQEAQNRERQRERDAARSEQAEAGADVSDAGQNGATDPSQTDQPDVVEMDAADSGLVETVESKPRENTRRRRAPKKPEAEPSQEAETPAAE